MQDPCLSWFKSAASWKISLTHSFFTSMECKLLASSLRCWSLGFFSCFHLEPVGIDSTHCQCPWDWQINWLEVVWGVSDMSWALGCRWHYTLCLSVFKLKSCGGLQEQDGAFAIYKGNTVKYCAISYHLSEGFLDLIFLGGRAPILLYMFVP